jgi:hypothetical protein
MSRRTPLSDQAGLSPLRRGQLLGLPLSGLVLGPLMALFYMRLLGGATALMLGGALSVVMMSLAGWIAYRSDFGGRQGIAGAALMLLLLAPLMSGAAVMTLSLAGVPQLSLLAVGTSLLSLAIAFVAGLRRQWLTLQREGFDGAWARTNVDPDAARLRASALLGADTNAAPSSPWLIAALAANGPLLYSTWGTTDAQAMPFVLAVLALTSVWVCARKVGPMAARGWFVLQLERHHGRRIVHEHHEELQALRREFWLSRWLMEKTSAGARAVPRRHGITAAPAPLWQRAALVALQIVAGLGLVGGATLAVVEAWPALDRSLRWGDYRPAEVVVESVEISARRSQWLGSGRVDGREVRFVAGELDALLGAPPASNNDARLATARARLPLLAQARWNPQAQRRLIALDAPRDRVDGQARFALGFSAALLGIGALGAWAWRALSRRITGRAKARASRRGFKRGGP